MLVSVIQAVITRNQLSGMLGGNSNLQWLSINSFFFFFYLFVIDHNHFRVSSDFPVIIIIYLQSNQVIVI